MNVCAICDSKIFQTSQIGFDLIFFFLHLFQSHRLEQNKNRMPEIKWLDEEYLNVVKRKQKSTEWNQECVKNIIQ